MKFNHIGTRFTCKNGNRGTIVGFAGDKYIVTWDFFGAKTYPYLIDEVDSEWEFLPVRSGGINFIPITITIEDVKMSCTHSWKLYQGLSEAYEFCTQCDEKRK
jgi:hypothetical protein